MFLRMILTMKLTDIRRSTSENRLLLVFEDGTKLRIWKQTAGDFALYAGKDLTEEEFSALSQTAKETAVKDRAVRIITSTNISKKGLARRLQQKGETADDAEKTVKWLEDLSLVDDRRTGEMVVRSALGKGYGVHRIRQILREKEIPQEYWEELLSDLPPMDAAVDKVLRQKLPTGAEKKDVQKAVDTLLRRGHTWQDIKGGLERFRMDMDLEDTECL